MENLSDGCHKKNFKMLITFLTLVVVVVVFCFIGLLFCYNPVITTYKVEYINGKNDILIQTYSKGEKLYLPDNPQKYGYNFIGWSFDKEENNLVNSELVVDKEITLYAKWEQKLFDLVYNGQSYKIDYSCAFDVKDESLSFIDNQNQLIKLDKVDKEGYNFLGWELCDDTYSVTDFDFVDLDKFKSSRLELVARYSANIVKFNINQQEGFSISNLSHMDSIKTEDTLVFDVVLNEAVNNSKIVVNSTSGVVSKVKDGNVYRIQISDFTEDFEVVINNISINEYEITFVNGDEVVVEYYEFGKVVEWPRFQKLGYE